MTPSSRITWPPVELDLSTGELRGAAAPSLTERELEAVAYLLEYAGAVVSVEALEKDVWGFSRATRSQAVPVALRRLRAKVGSDVLDHVRGKGWMLCAPQVPNTHRRPRPTTPYHPRPDTEDQVQERRVGGWRRIALWGPLGVGKTRLLHQLAPPAATWLHLQNVPPEQVMGILEDAAGSSGKELVAALSGLDGDWVLDGVAAEHPGLRALFEALPVDRGPRWWIGCRGAPTWPGVASVVVRPLPPDEAVAFLRQRVVRPASDAVLAEAARRTSNLPLAMEEVAKSPFGLEAALDSLRRGRLPHGLEAIREPFVAAWQRLPGPSRDLLGFLATVGRPVDLTEVEQATGGATVEALQPLLSHSVLTQEGSTWRLPELLSALVGSVLDLEPARRARACALVGELHRLRSELAHQPTVSLERFAVLRPELLDVARRGESAVDLFEASVELSEASGAINELVELAERVQRLDGDHGLALQVLARHRRDPGYLPLGTAEPRVRARVYEDQILVFPDVRPERPDVGGWEEREQLDVEALDLLEPGIPVQVLRDRGEALLSRCVHRPAVEPRIWRYAAMAYASQDDLDNAIRCGHRALHEAERHGLVHEAQAARAHLAHWIADRDIAQSETLLRHALTEARRTGDDTVAHDVHVSLVACAALQGRSDEALAMARRTLATALLARREQIAAVRILMAGLLAESGAVGPAQRASEEALRQAESTPCLHREAIPWLHRHLGAALGEALEGPEPPARTLVGKAQRARVHVLTGPA